MMTATNQPDPAVLRAALKISAVADEHRLGLLLALEDGSRRVGDLAELDDSGVSPRLAILRHAGMVEARREGKCRYYGLTEQGVSLVGSVKPLLREEAHDG